MFNPNKPVTVYYQEPIAGGQINYNQAKAILDVANVGLMRTKKRTITREEMMESVYGNSPNQSQQSIYNPADKIHIGIRNAEQVKEAIASLAGVEKTELMGSINDILIILVKSLVNRIDQLEQRIINVENRQQ